MKLEELLKMEPRKRDAWASEKIVGRDVLWLEVVEHDDGSVTPSPYKTPGSEPCYENSNTDLFIVPYFSTDPAADYEVLKHVRETWDGARQKAFSDAYYHLVSKRWLALGEPPTNHVYVMYEPGDYTLASLLALESE